MIKIRFFLLVTVLLCLVVTANEGVAQNRPGKRTMFKLAGQYAKDGDFQKSIDMYQQILEADQGNPEALYGLARTYQESMEHAMAQKWYEEVAKSAEHKFPELRYHLGYCQKMLGNYIMALDQFNKFLISRPDAPQELFVKANHERNGVLLAIDQLNGIASDYGFELLPSPVNTTASEIAMYVHGDDGTLTVLSSRGTTQSSVIDFSADNGIWLRESIPYSALGLYEGMEPSSGQLGGGSDVFYITLRPGNRNTWRLAAVPIIGNIFSSFQWLPDKINSRLFNTTDPTTSLEGDTLIFASDRPGGYGGYDLWYTVLNNWGEWRTPTNLGEVINTEGDERYPFYYGEKQMLFFSSDGHIGYGQMDVFFSLSAFKNAEVVNIGAPFNSGFNDLGLIMGGERGFISSDRKNGIGNYDVYTFETQARERSADKQDSKTAGSANMKNGME